ncbi:MAG: GlcNAc-transferase family protein [Vicinamibacterales bacterium]
MAERIFVQIAAYRDPELLPTLADCLAKAADPGRLRFGICWQRDESESIGAHAHDARFRIIELDYRRSRGACWARHRIQRLYEDEEYTLHLDSHHRFVDGWDDLCIEMLRGLQQAGSARPVLTCYAPHYDPLRDPEGRDNVPWRMRFGKFSLEGVVETRPEAIDEFASLEAPIPARFFSAHFAFTLGRFCRDVPYDPKLYFFGEEPTLAVRAFTHGYDLFHPHRIVVWHHYGRTAMHKHWSDHDQWAFHDARSLQRVRQLLRVDGTPCEIDFGPHGLGTARSLHEWEVHAGIHYGLRGVSDRALQNLPPPEPVDGIDEAGWAARFIREQHVRIHLRPDDVPAGIDDFDFWYVGAHSQGAVELFRRDLEGDELRDLLARLPCEHDLLFYSPRRAETWTVWPHSASRGWLQKITRKSSE